MEVKGKRVLIVGLARSGKAAALLLARRGAVVTVTDLRPPTEFQAMIPELTAHKIGLELGIQREETFLNRDVIIVSPGVPWDLGPLRAARERGVPVFPEIEVASWFLPARILGVTGTNGKSTTTALLGRMLETSGFSTLLGGNIGVPLTSLVDQVTPDSWIVAELSSYQLEAIQQFRPYVAVVLNITSHHTDRHASFESYVNAKAQVFRNQGPEDYAILNVDDPAVAGLAPQIKSRTIFFSRRRSLPEGVFVVDGQILYRVNHLERVLLGTREIPLKGEFNIDNVMAAAVTACMVGADFEAIRKAVREFRGLEHRLEFVREIRGVSFYNDSKATSVDAASKAIGSFPQGIHLILGGKDERASFEPLRAWLKGVRSAYLIGETALRMGRELSGATEIVQAGDLETAMRKAFERARPGEVILLAPACPSFDQFRDFEHRGRVFKEIAEKLAQENTGSGTRQSGPGNRESGRRNSKPGPGKPPERRASANVAGPKPATRDSQGSNRESTPTGEPQLQSLESRTPNPDSPAPTPELVYVYEVAAEEIQRDVDVEPEPPEEKFEVLDPEKLRPVESLDDELFPFEVRASEAGQTRSKEVTARKASGGQSRLPGI